MSALLLSLYHRLPPPLRSAAATLRGYQLSRWRYGKESERLLAEALEREHWSPERWQAWRRERLAHILERAATSVPYYREHWLERRRKGDHASRELLENWPILTKDQLRANPKAFVADDCNTRQMFEEHTSGTTGTPVTLWFKRETLRSWYALFDARWRRWYDVTGQDRWAMIGGQKVVPFHQTQPPFWVWNASLKQLYMSAMHVREDFLRHYLDALVRYAVVYLYGYSSTIYWLALQSLETGIRPTLKVVVTNAEPLYDYQRDVIEEAFQCPVRETYGQAEKVSAMSECEAGRLHLWPEVGYVELLDGNNNPVPAGQTGRLLCTGFLNDSMPLVRYEIMDTGNFPHQTENCGCGRTLPLMGKITGRLDDVILTKDGRRVALLDIIFGPEMHIREAQIIQETLDHVRIRVVPAQSWNARGEEDIRVSLRERLGDVEVSIEKVKEIERTWAGKFRVLISKVSAHQADYGKAVRVEGSNKESRAVGVGSRRRRF